MATYYVAEANTAWKKCNAKTLRGAKIAASRRQMFQGTDVYAGIDDGLGIVVVAQKIHRDALDMNATGAWRDLADYF